MYNWESKAPASFYVISARNRLLIRNNLGKLVIIRPKLPPLSCGSRAFLNPLRERQMGGNHDYGLPCLHFVLQGAADQLPNNVAP